MQAMQASKFFSPEMLTAGKNEFDFGSGRMYPEPPKYMQQSEQSSRAVTAYDTVSRNQVLLSR